MKRRVLCAGIFAATMAAGIGCNDDNPPAPPANTIGTKGGIVEINGVKLEFPEGALDQDRVIGLTPTSDPPPRGYAAYSPVYRFTPDGVTFLKPVHVTLPFTGDATYANVFWSQSTGTNYENRGGTVSGTSISADIMHFSVGFVASALIVPGDTTLDFGSVTLGTTAKKSITIKNTGAAVLALTTPALASGSSSAFTISGTAPASVAAGETISVDVEFAPTAVGTASGTVRFRAGAIAIAVDIALTGNGVSPVGTDAATPDAEPNPDATGGGMDATVSMDAEPNPDATGGGMDATVSMDATNPDAMGGMDAIVNPDAMSSPDATPDAGPGPGDTGAMCLPNGTMCTSNPECCSNRCISPDGTNFLCHA